MDDREPHHHASKLTEAAHVAAAIRGGVSFVHGIQLRKHAVPQAMV